MLMSKEQASFYLKRLRLFRNPAQIALMIDASRPSVDRWLAGELPREKMLPQFEDALCELFDDLEKEGWQSIVEVLDTERPRGTKKQEHSSIACSRWLKDLLSKKPMNYQRVLSKAADKGFSKSQISYAARQLGVRRDSIAKKGNTPAHSLWRLGDYEA